MPLHVHKKNQIRTPLLAATMLAGSAVLTSNAFAAPTANADNYTTTMNQSITVSPLSNDRADNGTTIFIEVVNSPSPYGPEPPRSITTV